METETRESQPPDASAEVKILRKKMLRLRKIVHFSDCFHLEQRIFKTTIVKVKTMVVVFVLFFFFQREFVC